jgi:hypothetical protein
MLNFDEITVASTNKYPLALSASIKLLTIPKLTLTLSYQIRKQKGIAVLSSQVKQAKGLITPNIPTRYQNAHKYITYTVLNVHQYINNLLWTDHCKLGIYTNSLSKHI